MTKNLPWFKCNPRDFLEGTEGLTNEECGVYVRLLCLMYRDGGPIKYDLPVLRHALHCYKLSHCRKLVQRLVDLGKLRLENGLIHNGRVDREIGRESADNLGTIPGQSSNCQAKNSTFSRAKRDSESDIDPSLSSFEMGRARGARPAAEREGVEKPDRNRQPARPRKLPLPANFAPRIDEAIANGLTPPQAANAAAEFMAHHRATGEPMADWGAAWEVWWRRAIRFRARDTATKSHRPKVVTAYGAVAEANRREGLQ